jgi:spermidine synthase
MPWAVAALLFGSGLCALVYQVAWLRELRLVFGASTSASAAVLAVFMGGLGAGGLWLGKRVGRRARPLALYAQLELGIAAASALTPGAVWLARRLYSAVGGTLALGSFGGTAARLVLAAVVLCVPTFLMGGTLPAAAQAVETDGDVGRRRLAILYGANTLGAVAGCVASTFVLLEVLGTRRMLWCACAINAIVAICARALARRMAPAPGSPTATGAVTETAPETETETAPESGPEPGVKASLEVSPRPPSHTRLVLIAAAIVGFAFLLMELVWYRMLGPILGGSSYTFGLILAIALLGIGLGGVAYALFAGRAPPTLRGFALTCAAEALCIALPFALGDRVALWAAMLRALGALGFHGHVAGWAVIASIVVLPAAFVSGVQFPLLIALLGRGRAGVGREVGLAYAWNTAGAILGSLAGGFGLLPLLSAPGAWRLVVALLGGLGVYALVVSLRREPRRVRALPALATAAAALALVAAHGPSAAWRHGAIGAGRGPSLKDSAPNVLRNFVAGARRAVIWEVDGVESSVAIRAENGYAFVVNGKIDGNSRLDGPTQVMSGLLGALLHGHVKRAMVIGLGTGSTAGWLGALPSIDRVDAAELEPAILHVAELCAPVNQRVLANPKVHIALGDAREQLLTTRARYDLIFSEPSNPYRAGIASLFTRDFYEAARTRLEPNGVFVQWLQAYSVDAQTVRTTYATLQSVFPEIETWVAQEGDLLLVASGEALPHDAAVLRARLAEEPYRSALFNVWRVNDLEGLLAHFIATPTLARTIALAEGDALSTDDLTLVEYGFARGVGRLDSLLKTTEVRDAAHIRGEDRPVMTGGTVDWWKVDARRQSMIAGQDSSPSLPYVLPLATVKHGEALDAWLEGDHARALEAWRAYGHAPEDPVELFMLADVLAERADVGAEAVIAKLRAISPVEADACLGRLRLRQERLEEATAAFEAAYRAWRTDPWPLPYAMRPLLRLAAELARKNAALGERLWRALGEPFAVRVLDRERLDTRRAVALAVDPKRLCVEAFAAYEPYVPWEREFLTARWQCYQGAGDGRAERARRELSEFAADDAVPFSTGLLPAH